jgi:hypothetical protein
MPQEFGQTFASVRLKPNVLWDFSGFIAWFVSRKTKMKFSAAEL